MLTKNRKPEEIKTAYMVSRQILNRFGISRTTLWSWLKKKDFNFPRPIIINGIRYFDEYEINKYEKKLKENYEKKLEEGKERYVRMVHGKNAKKGKNQNTMSTQQVSDIKLAD